ncbi:MAG: hypothetical protein RLY31_1048 [Bacteroidota bacterium]
MVSGTSRGQTSQRSNRVVPPHLHRPSVGTQSTRLLNLYGQNLGHPVVVRGDGQRTAHQLQTTLSSTVTTALRAYMVPFPSDTASTTGFEPMCWQPMPAVFTDSSRWRRHRTSRCSTAPASGCPVHIRRWSESWFSSCRLVLPAVVCSVDDQPATPKSGACRSRPQACVPLEGKAVRQQVQPQSPCAAEMESDAVDPFVRLDGQKVIGLSFDIRRERHPGQMVAGVRRRLVASIR